jgi:hypothetical protein
MGFSNKHQHTKSYKVDDNLHTLERNHTLFTHVYIQENPTTTRTINIRFTIVQYYSLKTYNQFNNRIISLPVLSYYIFLHLKVRNTWNIGYLSHAFQKHRRSRDYNVYSLSIDRICHIVFWGLFLAWCLHSDRADFVVHIFIVYVFDFPKEMTV